MPWRETSPMEQRLEFVREYATGLFTMTELAGQYGVSRKTGYKWLEQYEAEGVLGLRDRSRRPHHSPQATDPEVVDALVALRRRHPRWGARKLLVVAARRRPHVEWPSRATVCTLLTQRGLVTPRRRRARSPFGPASPLAPIIAVNQVWTTDFKGEFRTGDGVYCYPLTLRDGFSRFVLRCDAFLGRTTAATRSRFERAFRDYGLPERIRSDNGGPFASPGLGGLSQLSVWWMRLGIVPERIALGHPEQNGSHEQFHSVLKAATARPPMPPRNSSGFGASVENTTRNVHTKPCTTTSPRAAMRLRPDRCRRGCRRWNTPDTWKCGASAAAAPFRGAARRCLSPPRSPVNTSRSKKSTTGCGHSISAPSRSLDTMTVIARFNRS